MTAITAITAQNTLGVTDVLHIATEMVLAQMDAVIGDLGVDAVKIGMIGSAETARAVAARLAGLDVPIVFDPVMVATSGSVLAEPHTVAAFERLMAVASLVTPNAPELQVLSGQPVSSAEDVEQAALSLSARAGTALLAKGGDLAGATVIDLLVQDGKVTRWEDSRIETRHSHGTGCTLASAIAVALGRAVPLDEAVAQARRFVRAALTAAPGFGTGHGPMNHMLGAVPYELALTRS